MKLFAIFHLNLMFSAIAEADRPIVIDRCYRPLLQLAKEHNFPLGIEANAITLEIIKRLAPDWIDEFRALVEVGQCEFIGSGYGQLIGPLLPASVNKANLRIGNAVYQQILGGTPHIALVNEQAWSASLVQHYLDMGYKGVFMDYDNPARYAFHWPKYIQHYPQQALGTREESIPVIWSRSMVFQKLQRLAHEELELDAYIDYVEGLGTGEGWLPVYGNDAEIFDFRPGRYKTEARNNGKSEWTSIATAFNALKKRGHTFYLPHEVLNDLSLQCAGHLLSLESAEQPIPVKKQRKYNITRWAVTGRNDFLLNSLCRAVAAKLEEREIRAPGAQEAQWQELCYCWSSDFRTHITPERFSAASARLHTLAQQVNATIRQPVVSVEGTPAPSNGRLLNLKTSTVNITLNVAKGLAIHCGSFVSHDFEPVFGTLEHGFFHDITLGVDFFSGHLIMEGPGNPKTTDLAYVTPHIQETAEYIQAACTMELPQGHLKKAIRLHRHEQRIDMLYSFRLAKPPQGYLRMGYITLLTEHIDPQSLFYAGNNGGELESFPLKNKDFDHGNNVSFLVSSQQAMGMTDSRFIIGGRRRLGDAERMLAITSLIPEHAFIALVTCRQARPAPFVRVAFSSHELDETRAPDSCQKEDFIFSTGFSVTPYTTGR